MDFKSHNLEAVFKQKGALYVRSKQKTIIVKNCKNEFANDTTKHGISELIHEFVLSNLSALKSDFLY